MTTAVATVDDRREQALFKAVGLDRVPSEQRELALNIATRYDLDLMLKHVVLIEGRPYITRDGLLHVAHRSGVFDGIEVTDPVEVDGYWHARATVYRKDMSRGFAYPGRYPVKGRNATFGPEMATKVAEVMALRRAFDVSAPVAEERWDVDTEVAAPVTRAEPVPLAAKVSARRADIEARVVDPTAAEPLTSMGATAGARISVSTGSTDEPPHPADVAAPDEPLPPAASGEGGVPSPDTDVAACASVSPYDHEQTCIRERGHAQRLMCRDANGMATWPRPEGWK